MYLLQVFCASATSNLTSISFGVNTLIPLPVLAGVSNEPSKLLNLLFGDVLFASFEIYL